MKQLVTKLYTMAFVLLIQLRKLSIIRISQATAQKFTTKSLTNEPKIKSQSYKIEILPLRSNVHNQENLPFVDA